MLLWFISILFAFGAFIRLFSEIKSAEVFLPQVRYQATDMISLLENLQTLQDILSSGLVPEDSLWERFKLFPNPWGHLISISFEKLRKTGANTLPTLKRIQKLAKNHLDSIQFAKAKSAQSRTQAVIGGILAPLFSLLLYFLIPGISEWKTLWITLSLTAFCLSLYGIFWITNLAETASRGNLDRKESHWILLVQVQCERFLALIKSGLPPDLAWSEILLTLQNQAPELWVYWSNQHPETQKNRSELSLREQLNLLGSEIRNYIKFASLEGHPCSPRIENRLDQFNIEIEARIAHELELLPTRALKPLFLCMAPSLLGLLASGVGLGVLESLSQIS